MKCLSYIEIEEFLKGDVKPIFKKWMISMHLKKCGDCHKKFLKVSETVEFEKEMNKLIDKD